MDANRKRRARRLGVDEPDADLAKLSDAQLLRLFAREHSGEAALERARAARERVNPLFAHLDDLPDGELLAEHARAKAEVAAEAAALAPELEAAKPGVAPEAELLPVPPIEPWPTPPAP